jgi:hypothetical protein
VAYVFARGSRDLQCIGGIAGAAEATARAWEAAS